MTKRQALLIAGGVYFIVAVPTSIICGRLWLGAALLNFCWGMVSTNVYFMLIQKEQKAVKVQEAFDAATYNRERIEQEEECGCYYCERTFPASSVREFRDRGKTGVCPLCTCDSVVPGVTDAKLLREMHLFWFGPGTASPKDD